MSDREYYYVTNEDGQHYLCLEGGEIGWSKHIIDAVDFESEEEAEEKIKELRLYFCGVGWRSGPPQDFLYTNPWIPPKHERIRMHAHRLGWSLW